MTIAYPYRMTTFPTPEQVRMHAERYPHPYQEPVYFESFCLWRYRTGPQFYRDYRFARLAINPQAGTVVVFASRDYLVKLGEEWTACTPDGDPAELVEERDYLADQLAKERATVAELKRRRSTPSRIEYLTIGHILIPCYCGRIPGAAVAGPWSCGAAMCLPQEER